MSGVRYIIRYIICVRLGSQEFKPWLAFTRVTYTQFTNQIKHLYQNQKAPINAKLLSKVLWNIDLIFTILLSSSWTENSFRFNKKYWRTWIWIKSKKYINCYKMFDTASLTIYCPNLAQSLVTSIQQKLSLPS